MGNRALTCISLAVWGFGLGAGLALADPALPNLDPALRAQILDLASPEQRCQLEVLEKNLGIRFKAGAEAKLVDEKDAARDPLPDSPCGYPSLADAQRSGALDLTLGRNAIEFLTNLPKASGSFAAVCGFKYRASTVAVKSVDTLAANFAIPEKFTGDGCHAPGGWDYHVKIDPNFPSCPKAAASAAWFVECFRRGQCTGDCAIGATAAELNLLYDVYDENGDGRLTGKERDTFDDAIYPGEAYVGPPDLPGAPGIQSTSSATQGRKANRKYRSPKSLANQGPAAYTGVLMSVGVKGTYQKQYLAGEQRTPNGLANLGQNGMIVSVSPEATKALQTYSLVDDERPDGEAYDALISQFERDFAEIRALVRQLPFSPVVNGRATGSLAYEQITDYRNYDRIMNQSMGLTGFSGANDARIPALKKLYEKLSASPILNGVEVFVHPLGRVKLAQVALYMIHHHPDANTTFNLHPSSMNFEQPCRYQNAYVDRCLGRTRAEREAREKAAARKAGVAWNPACQRESVDDVR